MSSPTPALRAAQARAEAAEARVRELEVALKKSEAVLSAGDYLPSDRWDALDIIRKARSLSLKEPSDV